MVMLFVQNDVTILHPVSTVLSFDREVIDPAIGTQLPGQAVVLQIERVTMGKYDETMGPMPFESTAGEFKVVSVKGGRYLGSKRDGTPATPYVEIQLEGLRLMAKGNVDNSQEGETTPFIRHNIGTSTGNTDYVEKQLAMFNSWGGPMPDSAWSDQGFADPKGLMTTWGEKYKGRTVYCRISKDKDDRNQINSWGKIDGKHHKGFVERYEKVKKDSGNSGNAI